MFPVICRVCMMLVLSVLLRQMRIRLCQSPPNIELRRTLRLQPSPPLPYIQSAPACRGLLVASSFLLLRQNHSELAHRLTARLSLQLHALLLAISDVDGDFRVNAAKHEEYPGENLHIKSLLEQRQLLARLVGLTNLVRLGCLLRGIGRSFVCFQNCCLCICPLQLSARTF